MAGHEAPLDEQVRQRLMVPTACLDDLPIDDVDLMKIDVEGAEMPVLRGAWRLIERCRPVLIIEVQSEHLAAASSALHQIGYSLSDAESGRPPTDRDYSGNVLAIPSA